MSTHTPQGLTTRQAEILNVIETAMAEHGYAPTMREIGAAVGLTSTASVKYQLEILEQKGFIRRDESKGYGAHRMCVVVAMLLPSLNPKLLMDQRQ